VRIDQAGQQRLARALHDPAPVGASAFAPTFWICPSATTTVARARMRSPSNTRTSLNTVTLDVGGADAGRRGRRPATINAKPPIVA
jgi:hypothetical protein